MPTCAVATPEPKIATALNRHAERIVRARIFTPLPVSGYAHGDRRNHREVTCGRMGCQSRFRSADRAPASGERVERLDPRRPTMPTGFPAHHPLVRHPVKLDHA